MTAGTFRLRIGEDQGRMAEAAVDGGVLSFQRKGGCVVVKRIDLAVQLPSIRTVTDIAADLKIFSMGGVCASVGHYHDQESYGQ